MRLTRRTLLQTGLATAAATFAPRTAAAQPSGPAADARAEDRVFICNEDSNTLAVIDPRSNMVETSVNLTSFDEDPRRLCHVN